MPDIIGTLIKKIACFFCPHTEKDIKIKKLSDDLGSCNLSLKELQVGSQEIYEENQELTQALVDAKEMISELEENQGEVVDELETFWNNKREKSETLTYPGRPLYDDLKVKCFIDPRIYFTNDKTYSKIIANTNDEKAIKCLDFIKNNVTYVSDAGEFWQFAFETKQRRKGDCEDGAIYLANMMIANGIPYWRIRLNAGDVQGGGHAYVTYLAEKDNQWYILDWCYWYDESKNLKRTFREAEKYFGIWFSWNKKFIFPNDELDRETLKAKGVKL